MRRTLSGFCLVATLASAQASAASTAGTAAGAYKAEQTKLRESLEKIDGELQRGEWAAAEAESRSLVADALLRKPSGTFNAVARLALAEAGLGRTEDALWHWSVAQNLKVDFDPKPFGAPGELLSSHPLRHVDEVPAGLTVRRQGDGGDPFSLPRLADATKVEIPRGWGTIPKGMRLQVLVDAQGRPGQPVIVQSTSIVLTYMVLSSLRDWRFDAAQAGGKPVAAFYEIRFPEPKPLAQVVEFKGTPLDEPETMLRAGRYPEAAKQVGTLWKGSGPKDTIPSRSFLGVALALKALAQAGQGQGDAAICRWQAAQTLEPRLYGADLSAYGVAGRLLEEHPWGEPLPPSKVKKIEPGEKVQRPKILESREPGYPQYLRSHGVEGKVILESMMTATGVLRNLVSPHRTPRKAWRRTRSTPPVTGVSSRRSTAANRCRCTTR
jgi:hypothetical protein